MAISILVNRSSLTFSVLIPLGLSSLCVASPSYAAIINGGFETGDFTEWTIIGNTTIETAEFGSGPTEGTYAALVTNSSGSIAVPDLETFLGLELGSLNDLGNGITYNGSVIKQTFTANAGDILTFDWNFLKKEEPDPIFNDFAFVSVNSLSTLASPLKSSLVPFSNVDQQFDQQTKFQSSSFTIPNTGTYTLGLGVANVTDTTGDSGLLVDNVSLKPIPEPSSVLGTLTLGALGAGLLLKRKHKSVK
jgi:hypothetical protein